MTIKKIIMIGSHLLYIIYFNRQVYIFQRADWLILNFNQTIVAHPYWRCNDPFHFPQFQVTYSSHVNGVRAEQCDLGSAINAMPSISDIYFSRMFAICICKLIYTERFKEMLTHIHGYICVRCAPQESGEDSEDVFTLMANKWDFLKTK